MTPPLAPPARSSRSSHPIQTQPANGRPRAKALHSLPIPTNYLIDTDHSVIVDVEATRSIRQAEVGRSRTMLDRIKERFDLDPERLIADTAYGIRADAWVAGGSQNRSPHSGDG